MSQKAKIYSSCAALIFSAIAGLVFFGCNGNNSTSGTPAVSGVIAGQVYSAQLMPLNQNLGNNPTPSPSASAEPTATPILEPTITPAPTAAASPSPVTPTAAGTINQLAMNTAQVVVNGDTVTLLLKADGVAPNIQHLAHIHQGSQCATMSNDDNHDGVLDVVEASALTGPMLISLDSGTLKPTAAEDASPSPVASASASPSGSPGAEPSPTAIPMGGINADSGGNLTFLGTSSLSSLQHQLQTSQPDPLHGVGALQSGENLDFGSYVIEVHGVSTAVQLPGSVESLPGIPANETVPVLCGKFHLVAGTASPTPSASASASATPSATP